MTWSSDTGNRFAPGTFTPAPGAAPLSQMLAAQTQLELKLLLRNGEQLLLTMFIPITMLIGLCLLPFATEAGNSPAARAETFVPAVLAVAIMSTAFTGQAIAVGFDRRYGALKRLGATAIPRWGIIAGKALAVVLVVALQCVVIGGIGLIFGWRPPVAGVLLGLVIVALGTVTFACLGLLLGGTMKAEIVLALGNLIWFVLVAFAGLVVMDRHIPDAVTWLARATPSGALAESLTQASHLHVDLVGIGVLLAWAVVGGTLAARYFRFQ